MAKGVFEKTHAEHMKERDILIHFEALANEYGLSESETFIRFKNNMNELGYTIGSFIKGMSGERIARRALKLLSLEKGVRILYNVALEDEDTQAEYDAIVIAPYGMFVIEVKNWSSPILISDNGLLHHQDGKGTVYDLAGRMSIKEALLKIYLKDLFPDNYTGILLLSNEQTAVKDEYKQIPICFGGISYAIKSQNASQCLNESQIDNIANKLLESHKEQRTMCTVKCDEIIEDYAILMEQIEQLASNKGQENAESIVPTPQEKTSSTLFSLFSPIDWARIGKLFGDFLVNIGICGTTAKN